MLTETIVNLDECAREPIHIPGAIQPHGVLFVLTEPELTIVQVSSNCENFIGLPAKDLLNQGLESFLDPTQIELVRFALYSSDPNDNNPVKLQLTANHRSVALDAMVHRHGGFSVLELEPSTPANDSYFLDFFKSVSKITARLQASLTLEDLLREAALGLQLISGFDRVMVYRFSESGAGEVVAEAKLPEAEPYLGLWYPATDIPVQARTMYVLSPIRCIPDAAYIPAPLVPVINPVSRTPADLAFASLRSVSPIHCEYLRNMGVRASMSVSILRDGKLWGLVSCHHSSPRVVPYESRKACIFLGQVLSGEIARREVEAEAAFSAKSNAIQAKFLEFMAETPAALLGLVNFRPNLLDLIPAYGAAVISDDEVKTVGITPDLKDIAEIVEALGTMGASALFVSNSLHNHFSGAEKMAHVASGVIALTISRKPAKYILLFRPEIVQTVVWGGDPNKPVAVAEGGFRLSPRKSFAAWKETVKGSALPWTPGEVRAANDLRNLVTVVLFKR